MRIGMLILALSFTAAAQNAPQTANGALSGTAGLQAGQDRAMFEARSPIDLTNTRLRKLTAALGPAYLRVSGTWANTVYFHDSDLQSRIRRTALLATLALLRRRRPPSNLEDVADMLAAKVPERPFSEVSRP